MDTKHGVSPALAAKDLTDSEEHLEAAARLSDSAQKSVFEELHRLIASARFNSSHRCQALLRHVVENALQGNAGALKERSIGVEIFHRDSDYDTNSDPVVRIAAGEVRKKLAQYYYDSANQAEMRIELPPGSYVPVFSWSDMVSRTGEEGITRTSDMAEVPSEKQEEALPQVAKSAHRSLPAIRWLTVGFVVALASFLLFRYFRPKPPDAFETFWAPVVNSPRPVLLCVGHRMLTWSEYDADGIHSSSATSAKLAANDDQRNRAVMLLSDSITLGSFTALFRADRKAFGIRGQAFTRFEDLQNGPVVLLGAFNNDWTMRLMDSMRFHFAEDPNGDRQRIVDLQNPNAQIGMVRVNMGNFTTEDYALVVRIFDSQTRQPTVIAAGVTATATHAAGEFITNPIYLDDFSRKAPQNWQSKNMELLIVTKNVNGDSGSPTVVASYFW